MKGRKRHASEGRNEYRRERAGKRGKRGQVEKGPGIVGKVLSGG
jgi:hypothetical protein